MTEIPENRLLIVNNSHINASDTNPGTVEYPLLTIQAAANLARPRDTILIHEGIYREEVIPPRGGEAGKPITYQAAPGEKVIVRGSEPVKEWQKEVPPGIYSAAVPVKSGGDNPFAVSLINKLPRYYETMEGAAPKLTLGQVFLDSEMLDEVDTIEQLEFMSGTWLVVDNGARVMVHFPGWATDLSGHIVEFTVRKAVFRPEIRGLGYIIIRGLVLEHAANSGITYFWEKGFPPQQGLVSCRSGHHWVIENNIIRCAKSIGLDIGSEGRMDELEGRPTPGLVGYHCIQGNVISDNGQCGICGLGHIGTEIVGNVFERNNSHGAAAWEEAAIKTHFYINGRIEGNLIRGNYCNGIWLDNVYQNIRVTRNVILDNKGAGIFVEMGGGPCLIDNNIIALQSTGNRGIGGNGIYAHDAGGITIVHNFLAENAGFGVMMRIAVERNYAVYPPDIQSFEEKPVGELPCHCRNQRIENNIFVKNLRGAVDLPYPSEKAGEMVCNHNLYCDWENAGPYGVNITAGARMDKILSDFWSKKPEADGSKNFQHLITDEDLIITRKAWQAWLGMDQESASAEINNMSWQIVHPGPGPWLTFRVEQSGDLACPVYPELERDFNGCLLPSQNPAPGPFQAVQPGGMHHFRLWPIAWKNR